MAWNEPGGNSGNGGNRDNDPWGPRKKKDGPPDLDEVINNMKKKLAGWFGGGKKGGSSSGGGSSSAGGSAGGIGITVIVVIAVLIWASTGFYTVKLPERGVVQRFGVVTEVTGSGLHWHLPYPIERVTVKNIDKNRTLTIDQTMLTKDEKLVNIKITVNYSILDIKSYLFEIRDPQKTLRESLESALRETLSSLTLEEVLGQQRVASHQGKSALQQCNITYDTPAIIAIQKSEIEKRKAKVSVKAVKITTGGGGTKVVNTHDPIDEQVRRELKLLINKYKTGIVVNSIAFEKPTAPSQEVEQAFREVTSAQEKATRLQEEAWAYCQKRVNEARGKESVIIKTAEAYKIEKILLAKGEASRFLKILLEYEKAPNVARKRMYLESQQKILARTPKIYINTKSNGNVLFLPINKMLNQVDSADEKSKN